MARRGAADSLNPAVCEHSTRGANPRHCTDFRTREQGLFSDLRQGPAERAKLLRIVLSNCLLDAASVYPAYRKPFDLILVRANSKEWWALKDLNLRPTDYESAALTAELRARALISTTCTNFGTRRFFTVVEIVWTSEAPPAPAASTWASSTIASSAFVAFNSCSRSKACSMSSGVGCRYRSQTVTLLWAAIFMIVNASAASPKPVNIVWRNECTTNSMDHFSVSSPTYPC